MDKAIFIDKDGTLIQNVPYNVDPEKIIFTEYALESMILLQSAGYKIIIVSNQSGVALDYFKEEELEQVIVKIRNMLSEGSVVLAGFYYCPHSPASSCDCRKPLPGMLIRASEELQIDLSKSWMIGDILNDVEAGNRAGTKTILIDNGNETEWLRGKFRNPDYIVSNLQQAANIILRQEDHSKNQTVNEFDEDDERILFTKNENPFHSFWMGGYECTDKLNLFGKRVDFLNVTGHLRHLEEDYESLKMFKIKTVREGLRWSQVERSPNNYDWSTVHEMILCGIDKQIQQVWDLCHFGYPDDLTPLHPLFAKRFADFCRAFVIYYRTIDKNATLIVTPINEVSFIAWLGGEVAGTVPYCTDHGFAVKYALMKAYISGIEAMKEEEDNIRFLTTEPLVNMVPPLDASAEELAVAAEKHEQQFQVLEILSGHMCPELNGKPEYLDILGFNFYYNNQWITGGSLDFLKWFNDDGDSRWRPLSYLLSEAYKRYNRPIVLSETSHSGEHRPNWLDYITKECLTAIGNGIPLWGVCWYPIIDRPDWNNLHPWHFSGIWDVSISEDNEVHRILHEPTADALLLAQSAIENIEKDHAVLIDKPQLNGFIINCAYGGLDKL